ncbi:peptide deformylase [Peribacillus frigoritolerans]|nr:peptide deformylase [Peribacillus frigoritolerans]
MNPKIISHSATMIYLPQSEGCLSVDRDIKGYVPRYERVKIKALDGNGEEIEMRLKGFAAIVFQHELDHLNGMMFYDRINTEKPFQASGKRGSEKSVKPKKAKRHALPFYRFMAEETYLLPYASANH